MGWAQLRLSIRSPCMDKWRYGSIWTIELGHETKARLVVDLVIPWRKVAIRPNQDHLETQVDLGLLEYTPRDLAIWTTGLGLEIKVRLIVDLAIP